MQLLNFLISSKLQNCKMCNVNKQLMPFTWTLTKWFFGASLQLEDDETLLALLVLLVEDDDTWLTPFWGGWLLSIWKIINIRYKNHHFLPNHNWNFFPTLNFPPNLPSTVQNLKKKNYLISLWLQFPMPYFDQISANIWPK